MPNHENKEAWKLWYMVKGHLNTTEETVLSSQNGYFRRLWSDGCDGAPLYDYEEEFEIEWKKLMEKEKNDKLD